MSKRKPKSTPVQVKLDEDQLQAVDDLKARLNVKSRAEVLRQGLPYLLKYLDALAETGEPPPLEVSGDETTKKWKHEVLKLAQKGFGIAKCARKVKKTRKTVYRALENDDVFAELFDDARSECVEEVEHHLYKQATKEKPNVTAQLAYLNAHHPDYGQIRTQVLKRILGPFLDRIVKLAKEFVPAGLQHEFVARLGRDAERVALDAASGRT